MTNLTCCGLVQGDIGLNVAQMLVELIRDNRKIVDRITQDQIRMFVDLLQVNKVRVQRVQKNYCS